MSYMYVVDFMLPFFNTCTPIKAALYVLQWDLQQQFTWREIPVLDRLKHDKFSFLFLSFSSWWPDPDDSCWKYVIHGSKNQFFCHGDLTLMTAVENMLFMVLRTNFFVMVTRPWWLLLKICYSWFWESIRISIVVKCYSVEIFLNFWLFDLLLQALITYRIPATPSKTRSFCQCLSHFNTRTSASASRNTISFKNNVLKVVQFSTIWWLSTVLYIFYTIYMFFLW